MGKGLTAAAVAMFVIALSGSSQTSLKAPPKFEDYPATESFAGQPVAPLIVTAAQRRYRTKIREGVEKGWGVENNGHEQNKPGPNFAGDMIFIQWGCGSPCFMAAMVNARTGEVFEAPLTVAGTLQIPLLVMGPSVGQNPALEFRKNSRLMIMSATPNYLKKNARSYRHYFVWDKNRWNLVYRESLD